jgi:endothelin-converting enzyme/putative endopeptidase
MTAVLTKPAGYGNSFLRRGNSGYTRRWRRSVPHVFHAALESTGRSITNPFEQKRTLMLTRHALALPLILLLVACNAAGPARNPAAPEGPALGSFGIDTRQMDRTVRPGDDFYRYVNGQWLDSTEIPADKSRYGSFILLQDKTEKDVHALLGALGSEEQTDPTLKKVADLYAAWMDEATIEERGIEPLQPDLERIAAVQDRDDLLALMGDIHMSGPVGAGIYADPADSSRYAVYIGQSGLGMGRDYYVNEGPEYDAYRAAYRDYVAAVLRLLDDPDADEHAARVFDLETWLAEVHWTPAQRRDVQATYNPMDRDSLARLAPEIDWPVLLAASGLQDRKQFVVRETTAIAGGARLLESVPIETWKHYLTFHRVRHSSMFLPKAFDEAHFDFYSKTLRGTEQQRDRWKRGVSLVNHSIGEGLGQAYVDRYFPPGHKAKMDELVQNLLAAFEERLATLDWMDDATRAAALAKLARFEPRIGYPDAWRDYTDLRVEPGRLFESMRHAQEFEWQRQLDRLDEPVDRGEWFMPPQTVNAYYDPLKNQITFPAAILQPPFFDVMADPAVNYGAIGAVIGHEIGHGFDDQGRQFDEQGRLRNWWSEETEQKFRAATARLGTQYSSYCPIPGDDKTCVNGELTMGENIGDLGGLEMAYTAYRLSLEGEEPPVIDGYTGDQRFFMAWTQVWRGKTREDALRNMLLTRPHSPELVRGQAPQRNINAWYEAFNVDAESRMYLPPDERVHIW